MASTSFQHIYFIKRKFSSKFKFKIYENNHRAIWKAQGFREKIHSGIDIRYKCRGSICRVRRQTNVDFWFDDGQMFQVFGEKGKHARSAVGMISLPMNLAVEIEMIVEVED